MIDLRKLIQDFSVREAEGRVERDRRRVMLFVAAVQQRAVELTLRGEGARAEEFAFRAAGLVAEWVMRGQRVQFPRDLFGDPFKRLRERTREFAREWGLAEEFRREIGA